MMYCLMSQRAAPWWERLWYEDCRGYTHLLGDLLGLLAALGGSLLHCFSQPTVLRQQSVVGCSITYGALDHFDGCLEKTGVVVLEDGVCAQRSEYPTLGREKKEEGKVRKFGD